MSFRGVMRFRLPSTALGVRGGAVDGLADLAKAFVDAPIMRRKLELAEKRQAMADADHRDELKMRHEEHDLTLQNGKLALDLKRDQLNGKKTTPVLKPEQQARITMGIMAHARQAGTMKVGDGIETFDEPTARKEYDHLRRLLPDAIRPLIPDWDGAQQMDAPATAAQHDALTGAAGGADGDGHDAETTADAAHDAVTMGPPSPGTPGNPQVMDSLTDEEMAGLTDMGNRAQANVSMGRDPMAGAKKAPRTRLDYGDVASFVGGDQTQRPIAAARLKLQQGEIDTGRTAGAADAQAAAASAAQSQQAAVADAERASKEDAVISTIVPALHPQDRAAFQRIVATGDPQRIAIARKRLLQLAQPAGAQPADGAPEPLTDDEIPADAGGY